MSVDAYKLRMCKTHVKGHLFDAIVVEGNESDVLFAAEGTGWTKATRAECQLFINKQINAARRRRIDERLDHWRAS